MKFDLIISSFDIQIHSKNNRAYSRYILLLMFGDPVLILGVVTLMLVQKVLGVQIYASFMSHSRSVD